MTIETRLKNLENLVDALSKKIDRNTFYSDADTAAVKKNVGDITPYTETKTAYIGDTDIVFADIPEGNMTVFVKDDNGGYPSYTVGRVGSTVTVYFEPLEYITTVTISIS